MRQAGPGWVVQTGVFVRKQPSHGLDDDDLIALQAEILKGKSVAYRVYYAHFARPGMVFLLTVYGKSERENLTRAE